MLLSASYLSHSLQDYIDIMIDNPLYDRHLKLDQRMKDTGETLLGLDINDSRAVSAKEIEPDLWMLTDYLWMSSGDWILKSKFRMTGEMMEKIFRI